MTLPLDEETKALRLRFGLVSQDDLARLIGVSLNTLQLWRMQGRGPAWCKLGKQVFYTDQAILSWIATARAVGEEGSRAGASEDEPEADGRPISMKEHVAAELARQIALPIGAE